MCMCQRRGEGQCHVITISWALNGGVGPASRLIHPYPLLPAPAPATTSPNSHGDIDCSALMSVCPLVTLTIPISFLIPPLAGPAPTIPKKIEPVPARKTVVEFRPKNKNYCKNGSAEIRPVFLNLVVNNATLIKMYLDLMICNFDIYLTVNNKGTTTEVL